MKKADDGDSGEDLRRRVAQLERELAELRKREALLGAIFELAPDAIFVKDLEGRYSLVNPAAARFLDHPVSELVGRTDAEIWGEVDAVREVRAIEREVARKKEPRSYERRGISDGMERVFSSTKVPAINNDGELVAIIGIGREITEWKLAEESLQKHKSELESTIKERTEELESINSMLRQEIAERKRAEQEVRSGQEMLKDIFDNVPIGIYRTTPGGKIVAANPALLRMLGYASFEELTSHSLDSEVYEPDYPRSRFKELLERDGYVIGLESVWTKLDTTKINVRENARAIRGPDGRIEFYEGTVEDITEHRKLERLLEERARAELNGFIVSALPVFASNVPPEVRDRLIANFEERFRKNAWPNFNEEMQRLWGGPGVEDGCREDPALMLEVFLTWISTMLSHFGIKTRIVMDAKVKALEIQSCPWKDEAKENPIFCAICKSMIVSSFGWTCLKGEAKQTASHSTGAGLCRFEFNVVPQK